VSIKTSEKILEGVPFALAESQLRRAGEMRIVAGGVNMLPAIAPGDELIAHRARLQDIRTGDVVLFAQQGRWFLQRVREISSTGTQSSLMTQGDALTVCGAPVFAEELLARATFLVRDGEQRVISPANSLPQRMLRAAVRHVPHFATACLHCHQFRSRLNNLRQSTSALAHTKFHGSV
jgi:hypothetical protein